MLKRLSLGWSIELLSVGYLPWLKYWRFGFLYVSLKHKHRNWHIRIGVRLNTKLNRCYRNYLSFNRI